MRYLVLAINFILLAAVAFAQNYGAPAGMPQNVPATYWGASPAAADNSTAINNGLYYCNNEEDPCIVYLPGNARWQIENSLVFTGGPAPGMGLEGPGTILVNASNLPVIEIEQPGYGLLLSDLALYYEGQQTSSDTASYCIYLNMGGTSESLYNSDIDRVTCEYSWRGLGESAASGGSFWGDRVEGFRCYSDTGACIVLADSSTAAPNDYFGNIYVDAEGATCSDLWQVNLQYLTQVSIDNYEVNDNNCGILYLAGNRGVSIRNIRTEEGTIPSTMAGDGMIETNGDCVTIENYEVMNIEIDVGSDENFFLYKDEGSYGCTDQLRGNLDFFENSISSISGSVYGTDSPTVPVAMVPWQLWYSFTDSYSGDVYTGDASPNNVIDEEPAVPKPVFALSTGAGSSPSITEDTYCNGKKCYVTVTTGTSPTASATIFTATWTPANTSMEYWGTQPHCSLTPVNANANNLYATSGKAPTYAMSGGSNLPSPTAAELTVTAGTTALTASTAYEWEISCGG